MWIVERPGISNSDSVGSGRNTFFKTTTCVQEDARSSSTRHPLKAQQVKPDVFPFRSSTDKSCSIWGDSLVVPAYLSVASAIILILHVIVSSKPVKQLYRLLLPKSRHTESEPSANDRSQGIHPASFFGQVKEHVHLHGGPVIFTFKVLRLFGCLTLLGVSLATFILEEAGDIDDMLYGVNGKWGKKRRKHKHTNEQFTQAEWVQVALVLTSVRFVTCSYLFLLRLTGYQTFTSLLALISVSSRPRCSRLVSNHLTLLLLALFGVYLYRDIWPMATFNKNPVDSAEGWLLWAKLFILSVTSVVLPLFQPRQFTPVNPQDNAKPSPEQTTPLISLVLWMFLDSTVWLAYKVPHLKFEQLPPLADYDAGKNLVNKSFPKLDPFSGSTKGRHLFWGLLSVYRYEYMALALMLVIHVCCGLASPIGINQLLQYLESNGEKTNVKPWVWVSWLFLAPLIDSIAFQWYIFLAVCVCSTFQIFDANALLSKTRTLVRTEGILTQLIFSHSLRIRMKAELPEGTTNSDPSTAAPTPDNASVADEPVRAGASESSGGSDRTLAQSSLASVKSTKGKLKAKHVFDSAAATQVATPEKKKNASADNLIGKINNLVTTDLNNITEGRDFLFIRTCTLTYNVKQRRLT